MRPVDATHEPSLRSWVESANHPESDFPIQNLPWCRFQARHGGDSAIGAGIGDFILDLGAASRMGLLPSRFAFHLQQPTLAAVMSLPVSDRIELRRRISDLLNSNGPCPDEGKQELLLVDRRSANLLLPVQVSDYTDFYSSVFHATNVGCMFRPDNPLLPNYKHIPIGYHGRASSLVPDGTPVRRPSGQLEPPAAGESPLFEPCKLLDYELEVGFYVGIGNELGNSIPLSMAEDHIFGLSLVNDWSARDIQRWEYQPLGPFLAKSFATTVSPWVVTLEALAPFRCPAFRRPSGDPVPLPYLCDPQNESSGGFDVNLVVLLSSEQMREKGIPPMQLSQGNLRDMYWTFAQMLAHHSSNGCNMQTGDLLASGTVSGPERKSRGCLMELTWDGDATNPLPGSSRTPIVLPTGEQRRFLADGDEVIFRGYCQTGPFRRIGFGECRGEVLPARLQKTVTV